MLIFTDTVTPENATNKYVIWYSDHEDFAKVDGGVVTAVKAGTATMTVTNEASGKTADCADGTKKTSYG